MTFKETNSFQESQKQWKKVGDNLRWMKDVAAAAEHFTTLYADMSSPSPKVQKAFANLQAAIGRKP